MKKILFVIAFLLIPSYAQAVNELGWTAEASATWATLKGGPDPLYTFLADKIDNNRCLENNYGMGKAAMYKIENDASYCTSAYNNAGGCTGADTSCSGVARNKTRDCLVERALVYSICADVVTGAQKTIWESDLDTLMTQIQGSCHGTRPWDTDELIGHAFGCWVYSYARYGDNTACNVTNAISGNPWGDIDTTGTSGSLRGNIRNLWTNYGAGDFVEGTIYNLNTVYYTLAAVEALNGYTGTDNFPEITSKYDDIADEYYQRMVPDYGSPYQWGDIDGNFTRNNGYFRSKALYALIAHADSDDSRMWNLWDFIKDSSTSCSRGEEAWSWWIDHDATRNKASGVTYGNSFDTTEDGGIGTGYWHEGWNTNDTFVASQFRSQFFADHDWNTFENWEIYKEDDTVITARRHNPGDQYYEHAYVNGALVFGGYAGFREAKGQTAWEAFTNGFYHSGVTSGFWQNQGKTYGMPPFVDENSAQHLFRHNDNDTETMVLFNRIKACKPTSTTCMDATQKNALDVNTRQNYDRSDSAGWEHNIVVHADISTAPTRSSSTWSWTDDNGDVVRLWTGMDDPTNSATVDMENASYNCSSPYYFCGSIKSSEKFGYQVRLQQTTANDYTLYPMLNVVHVGESPTFTALSDTSGDEDAKGVQIETSNEHIVYVFNAEDDTTTTFTSYLGSGNSAVYDANRKTLADGMSHFKTGSNVSFNTINSKDIEVYIMPFKHTVDWDITVEGVDQTCDNSGDGEPSDEGLCHFSITGAPGNWDITWTAGDASCAEGSCAPCQNESACIAITGCQWTGSECQSAECSSDACNNCDETECGETSGCTWNVSECVDSSSCAVNPSGCENSDDCTDNEWCWEDGICKASCTPQGGVEIDTTATEDTYIKDGSTDTTNYDSSGVIVVSTGSGEDSDRSSIIKFDLSSVPSNAQIYDVTLKATLSQAPEGSSKDVKAFEVLQTWVETEATYDVYATDAGDTYYSQDANCTVLYTFDDTSGNIIDRCSGQSNDGTVTDVGSETMYAGAGQFNNAINFDDEGDFIAYETSINPGSSWTISFWIKDNGLSDSFGCITCDGINDSNEGLYIRGAGAGANDGKLNYWDGTADRLSTATFDDGSWHHVLAVNDGGTLDYWKDCVNGNDNLTIVNQSSTTHDYIGKDNSAASDMDNVLLDEFAFFNNTAFGQSECDEIKANGLIPNGWGVGGGKADNVDIEGIWNANTEALASYTIDLGQTTDDEISFTGTSYFNSFVQENIGSTISIILHSPDASGSSDIRFYDTETGDNTKHPKLTIGYTTEAPITPPVPGPGRTIGGGKVYGKWGN